MELDVIKITIEEIDGINSTMIKRRELYTYISPDGPEDTLGWTCTVLPPLPRHPEPKDIRLLYRYMSEGIKIIGELKEGCGIWLATSEYALSRLKDGGFIVVEGKDEQGNKIDIAITEE